MKKKSKITIDVDLDGNHIPEKILWTAPDGGIENESTPLLVLNVWDDKAKELLKVDLWTKELPVNELQAFFYQNIVTMANTYERATSDNDMGEFFREMAEAFADRIDKKLGI